MFVLVSPPACFCPVQFDCLITIMMRISLVRISFRVVVRIYRTTPLRRRDNDDTIRYKIHTVIYDEDAMIANRDRFGKIED